MTEPKSNGKGPRLIVADDSADVRLVVRHALRSSFDEIDEASDGRTLMWKLHVWSMQPKPSAGPLVVIADLVMPIYSGLDVLEAWRSVDEQFSCIIISSFPERRVERRVAELGAVLVPKPFSLDALRGAVDGLLQRDAA